MPKEYDPTDWVDEWPIPELSDIDRKLIKAVLLKAQGAFLRSDSAYNDPYAFVPVMEQAYDGIAEILFDAGILTHDFLGGQLRFLIVEFAVRVQWFAAPLNQKPVEAFPGYWGSPGPWLAFNSTYKSVFGAPLVEWRARLLEREASTTESKSPSIESTTRRTFIEPLLRERGWSILDWANEAGVSYATAQDYLLEKTKPYASTVQKLAKALGVSIQSLPR